MTKKPKTQQQLDRAADLRLKKTYNISLKDYNLLLSEGEGCCWICGRPQGQTRLHVDHDHSWKKVVLQFVSPKESGTGVWFAKAVYNGNEYTAIATKKSVAARAVKRKLLRASVRGLLCYNHNSGLQKFSDRSDWLGSAAAYISKFVTQGGPLSTLNPG